MKRNYQIKGKPFSLEKRHPLEQVYADQSRDITIIKSAQCGISEYAVAASFHFMDQYGENVFYAFPAREQIKDFVQGRINPRIDESDYIRSLMVETDNTNLKQFGNYFIYLRGSQNRRQITTADAGFLVMDEFDDMIRAHISLMEKRLGDSRYKFIRRLGVPKHDEDGIHLFYLNSDRHEYFLTCQHCGHEFTPAWDKNISPAPSRIVSKPYPAEVFMVCDKCGERIDRSRPGRWIAQNPGAEARGYHISKLIFADTDLRALYIEFRETQNLADFFNSNLGLPFAVGGSQLDNLLLNRCRRTEEEERAVNEGKASDFRLGADVGSLIYFEITGMIDGVEHVIEAGSVPDLDDLKPKMNKYDIPAAVIDGLPETRKAKEFAAAFPGRVYLSYYSITDPHKTVDFKNDEEYPKVLVNRTRAMDEVVNQYYERSKRLPMHADLIPEFYDHMKAPKRIEVVDKNGNKDYKYTEGNRPDHSFHAGVYAHVARQVIMPGIY